MSCHPKEKDSQRESSCPAENRQTAETCRQSEMDQAGRRGILQGSGSLDRRSTHQETARPEVRTARQAIGQTGGAAIRETAAAPEIRITPPGRRATGITAILRGAARPEGKSILRAIGQTGIAAVLQEKEHPGEKGRARGGITETGQTGLRVHDL